MDTCFKYDLTLFDNYLSANALVCTILYSIEQYGSNKKNDHPKNGRLDSFTSIVGMCNISLHSSLRILYNFVKMNGVLHLATYKQIQEYINKKHGYVPKTCWIAHIKEIVGLKPKISPNRHSINKRVHPCPENKQADLNEAFKYFNMI